MNVIKLSVVLIGVLALGGPVWADVGDQKVDGVIPAGTATLDGNLSEWSGAVWKNIDQFFTGDPNTLDAAWNAEWTARWSGDTVYVAVRVTDSTPVHSDAYISYFESDVIELYSRGSGVADGGGGSYGNTAAGYGPAQQYVVGITDTSLDSGGGDSWQTLGNPTSASFPDSRVIVNNGNDALTVATSATGAVGGQHELVYEIAMKQYNAFDQANVTTGLRTLALGDTVGFAVAGVNISINPPETSPTTADYAGEVSAGGQGGMFNMFDRIGLYQLVGVAGDFNDDDDVDGSDFLQWQRGQSPTDSTPTPAPTATDLEDWEANFGTAPPALQAATAAVPEPSSLILLAAASLSIFARRRQR